MMENKIFELKQNVIDSLLELDNELKLNKQPCSVKQLLVDLDKVLLPLNYFQLLNNIDDISIFIEKVSDKITIIYEIINFKLRYYINNNGIITVNDTMLLSPKELMGPFKNIKNKMNSKGLKLNIDFDGDYISASSHNSLSAVKTQEVDFFNNASGGFLPDSEPMDNTSEDETPDLSPYLGNDYTNHFQVNSNTNTNHSGLKKIRDKISNLSPKAFEIDYTN